MRRDNVKRSKGEGMRRPSTLEMKGRRQMSSVMTGGTAPRRAWGTSGQRSTRGPHPGTRHSFVVKETQKVNLMVTGGLEEGPEERGLEGGGLQQEHSCTEVLELYNLKMMLKGCFRL